MGPPGLQEGIYGPPRGHKKDKLVLAWAAWKSDLAKLHNLFGIESCMSLEGLYVVLDNFGLFKFGLRPNHENYEKRFFITTGPFHRAGG